jgi:VanZ family protein
VNKLNDIPVVFRVLAVTAGVLLILWLSLKPVPLQLADFPGWSKVNHAVAYCGLTLLTGWAFAALPRSGGRCWLLAVVVSVSIGGLMEILQALLTTTRHARLTDLLADCIGAVLAWSAVTIAGRLTGKKRDRSQCLL